MNTRLWYRDVDGDGFGNPSATLLGCESGRNAPPMTGYIRDNTDCDDANSNAKPGQTAFFTSARANGTYDYDCSATITKETVYPNATCGYCSLRSTTLRGESRTTTCTTAGQQSGLSCSAVAPAGFVLDSACGAAIANNYRTCGPCSKAGSSASSMLSTRLMGCR